MTKNAGSGIRTRKMLCLRQPCMPVPLSRLTAGNRIRTCEIMILSHACVPDFIIPACLSLSHAADRGRTCKPFRVNGFRNRFLTIRIDSIMSESNQTTLAAGIEPADRFHGWLFSEQLPHHSDRKQKREERDLNPRAECVADSFMTGDASLPDSKCCTGSLT